MNHTRTTQKTNPIITIAIDVLAIVIACLIPTITHVFSFPLYKFNPMLLVLLGTLLVVRDRRNAYLLAVVMPLVSCIVVGMPIPVKAICMMVEYSTVIALFCLLDKYLGRRMSHASSIALSLIVAVAVSKMVYYGLMAIL